MTARLNNGRVIEEINAGPDVAAIYGAPYYRADIVIGADGGFVFLLSGGVTDRTTVPRPQPSGRVVAPVGFRW